MGDTIPESIELVDDADYEGTVLDVGRGYTFALRFLEDSIRLRIEQQNNTDIHYREDVTRDFFESRQKRSTVANEIAKETTLDSDFVKARFRDVRQFVESVERRAMASDGKALLERTQDVRAYKTPEELTISVWLEAPDDSLEDGIHRIEFNGAEFQANSAEPLKKKHFRAFLDRLRIADEDWTTIRNEWLGDVALEQSEALSEDDVIADRVVSVLASRISSRVYDDPEPLANSDTAALYEPADESKFDEDIVWVQSVAIQQVLERETSKQPAAYIGTLARTLLRQDITLDSSTRRRVAGERLTMYPFDADSLGIDKLAVQSTDRDNDGSDDDDDASDIGIER